MAAQSPRSPTYDKRQTFLRTSLFEALEAYEAADIKFGRKGFYGQKLSMAGREDILRKDGIIRPLRFTCDDAAGDAAEPLTDQILNVIGDAQIVIVTKADEDESNTKYAQGGLAVVTDFSNDGFHKHIDDTISECDTFDSKIDKIQTRRHNSEQYEKKKGTFKRSNKLTLADKHEAKHLL